MALISCPKCSGVVSTKAAKCPHCGRATPSALQGFVVGTALCIAGFCVLWCALSVLDAIGSGMLEALMPTVNPSGDPNADYVSFGRENALRIHPVEKPTPSWWVFLIKPFSPRGPKIIAILVLVILTQLIRFIVRLVNYSPADPGTLEPPPPKDPTKEV